MTYLYDRLKWSLEAAKFAHGEQQARPNKGLTEREEQKLDEVRAICEEMKNELDRRTEKAA